MEEEIIKIISHVTNYPAAQINISSDIREYGVDSLNFVRIVVNIEEKFNVEFADSDLINTRFSNINSLTEYVKHRSTIMEQDHNF
jgi:acyl carrier protein